MLWALMSGPKAKAKEEEMSLRVSVNRTGFCFCGMALETCVFKVRRGAK